MKNNRQTKLANLLMLETVAKKLDDLCEEVVFLGGCTTALLISDPVAPDVRRTLDVDCIVDVISLNQYNQFSKKLRQKGFCQSMQDSVLCRWRVDGVVLDVMPTNEKILGFGNRWYQHAISHAKGVTLDSGRKIQMVTAPLFLATKLEAFRTRGKSDYLYSHDFEDIISVIDGRTEIVEEVLVSPLEVKKYLQLSFEDIIKKRQFQEALPGHLNYSLVSVQRVEIVMDRIARIISDNL